MRLPNGYGSVYKLSGNRRKPWIARKTDHIERGTGKQIYKIIGYYATRAEALQALADYNNNPYDINAAQITFKELYEKWSEKKYETISDTSGYISAYKISEPLYDMRFADIKTDHMQAVIDKSGKNYPMLKKIKILYNQMFRYAMERDIVAKDYSKFIDIGKNTLGTSRRPFTQKEIDKLFKSVGTYEDVESVLIMIYSGLRPGELIIMETENVDLKERAMIGGIKTDAGKDRVIPINQKILPMIQEMVFKDNKYLLVDSSGKPFTYDRYRDHFMLLMDQLGMKHKPHDCRHTFATLMGNAGANTVALQKIIGHASYNTTANTYTHKDIDELRKAVDLI
jgi:integrase